MKKQCLTKPIWKSAIGANPKAKRLKLQADNDGLFSCPVHFCEHGRYHSKRGCRKHVYTKHGWYYYFEEKPEMDKVFPSLNTRKSTYKLPQRSKTSNMPMFLKTCKVGCDFKLWLQTPGGGGKVAVQADQTLCKVLKYLKFCCSDVSSGWNVPETVVDYCLQTLNMLSDFVEYLQNEWKIGYSGIIGYMNALGHLLDFRRTFSNSASENVSVFLASEIYFQRVKRFLSKKMTLPWNDVLSVDYLNSINCWATLADLQKVIPFHANRYKQIILNSTTPSSCIAPHDLSFATSFIVAVLFLMVKASRPMTYKHLTVEMIKLIGENGIIIETLFKTNEKYGFDSLLFSVDVLPLVTGYMNNIPPRLNPACNYLLVF